MFQIILTASLLIFGYGIPLDARNIATSYLAISPTHGMGYQISDAELQQLVQEKLRRGWDAKYTNINVQVANGEVTLTGYVETEADRIAVERRVWSIPEIRFVENRLEIRRISTRPLGERTRHRFFR